MSNELAIGAVTATLSSLLQNVNQGTGLNGVSITTKPPDKARDGTSNQINLFLYQLLPNGAWRNMDIPERVRSGETSMPPLALNLYYMMTAYGDSDNDVFGHLLLGHAMRILYDNAVLGPDEIKTVLASPPYNLVGDNSELQNQVERVRITLQPLSVEEIFRLWSGFQTQYRVSVAYEVAVVLIESKQPTKTSLPVLRRGGDNRGTTVQPDSLPFPTIFNVRLANQKPRAKSGAIATPIDPNIPQPPIALAGETLVISGRHLDGDNVTVLFMTQRLSTPIRINIQQPSRTAQEVPVTLVPDPTNPIEFPAGFYTVAIVVAHVIHQAGQPDQTQTQTTNQLSFALAPQIRTAPPIPNPTRANNGDVTITLSCSPKVLPEQRVTLLLNLLSFIPGTPPEPRAAILLRGQEFLAEPHPISTDTLTFKVGNVPKGDYHVRLRIDGVDSFLVDRNADLDSTVSPPTFDNKQKVTVP